MPRSLPRTTFLVALLAGAVLVACSDSTSPPKAPDCTSVADTTQPATVSYQNDIRPFFEDDRYSCTSVGCHGTDFQGSEYLLATYEQMFVPGPEARSRGVCVVKPGDPDASYIIWKIEGRPGAGARMPKNPPAMSDEDIGIFRQWILEGARNN